MSDYDLAIQNDNPVFYFQSPYENALNPSTSVVNTTAGGRSVNTGAAVMPNGDAAAAFNGRTSYVEFPDAPNLSVSHTGILTIEAWLRPDALQFPDQEGSGYVHWMGKGELPGQMEWATRMYGTNNSEGRENRISGYAFNPQGGRGIGSYYQEDVDPGQWIHYVLVINTTPGNGSDPGYTKLFIDGANNPGRGRRPKDPWDDKDTLSEFWPDRHTRHVIEPEDGDAPLRIGTRDFRSFFEGAIGKVAIYDYELTPQQIQGHYDAMWA